MHVCPYVRVYYLRVRYRTASIGHRRRSSSSNQNERQIYYDERIETGPGEWHTERLPVNRDENSQIPPKRPNASHYGSQYFFFFFHK